MIPFAACWSTSIHILNKSSAFILFSATCLISLKQSGNSVRVARRPSSECFCMLAIASESLNLLFRCSYDPGMVNLHFPAPVGVNTLSTSSGKGITHVIELVTIYLSLSRPCLLSRGAWAIFPGAQPTEQPRRDPGGG